MAGSSVGGERDGLQPGRAGCGGPGLVGSRAAADDGRRDKDGQAAGRLEILDQDG